MHKFIDNIVAFSLKNKFFIFAEFNLQMQQNSD